MIYEINDTFPSRRYKGETIRQVLQKDSGYIKDLIMKSNDFSLSDECFAEAMQITKGLQESWERPENPKNIFEGLKKYAVPYGFDFNDNAVKDKNNKNRG
ncbi:MAG: hypothetical protein IJ816_04440 [Alloprevotella sp.]|nr:hypothetical protein [Alloprevotella sp.]